MGFDYTLPVGGFDGFERIRNGVPVSRKTYTSGYCTSAEELAIASPRADVHTVIKPLLQEELETAFRRYVGVASYLDEMYEKSMRPFVRSLP